MKKIISSILAVLCVSCTCATAFAKESEMPSQNPNETVYIAVYNPETQQYSLEQPTPYIDVEKPITIKAKNKSYNYTSDVNLLTQDLTIDVTGLSENIETVQVGFSPRRSYAIDWSDDLTLNDTWSYNDISPLNGWNLYVKVTSGNISSSNPGTVTLHVYD